ncbi:MAG: DUF2892 domain-containing protein [Candidatus Nanohaloarchaea archaeon]
METNVGDTDRLVRLALGVVLVAVSAAGFLEYVALSPVVAGVVGLVGVVLLATGYTRSCALYQVLGMSTSGGEEREESHGEIEEGPAEEPETPEDWEEEP